VKSVFSETSRFLMVCGYKLKRRNREKRRILMG
jgi:hypothetical protein